MKKKKPLFMLLACMIISCSYCLSLGSSQKVELCVINDNYNPNFAEDYSNASTEVKVAWSTMEAVIGYGIGLINPLAGLGYAL